MHPSLCESCAEMREVRTARSRFLLCELSAARATFPKYPRQPVVRCAGYRPATDLAAPGETPDRDAGPAQ